MKSKLIALAAAAIAPLALAACGSTEWILGSSGVHANDFINHDVARAYVPLRHVDAGIIANVGAAVIIAPGIAVTNAHLADLLGADTKVIGKSRDNDLLYFRTERQQAPPQDLPYKSEKVIAYGQGLYGDLREARGVVNAPYVIVEPRCVTCNDQRAFTFEADAGPGFSGGPVVDVASGHIVGITFGYKDEGGHRVMYAYAMNRVRNELAAIEGRLPSEVEGGATR